VPCPAKVRTGFRRPRKPRGPAAREDPGRPRTRVVGLDPRSCPSATGAGRRRDARRRPSASTLRTSSFGETLVVEALVARDHVEHRRKDRDVVARGGAVRWDPWPALGRCPKRRGSMTIQLEFRDRKPFGPASSPGCPLGEAAEPGLRGGLIPSNHDCPAGPRSIGAAPAQRPQHRPGDGTPRGLSTESAAGKFIRVPIRVGERLSWSGQNRGRSASALPVVGWADRTPGPRTPRTIGLEPHRDPRPGPRSKGIGSKARRPGCAFERAATGGSGPVEVLGPSPAPFRQGVSRTYSAFVTDQPPIVTQTPVPRPRRPADQPYVAEPDTPKKPLVVPRLPSMSPP